MTEGARSSLQAPSLDTWDFLTSFTPYTETLIHLLPPLIHFQATIPGRIRRLSLRFDHQTCENRLNYFSSVTCTCWVQGTKADHCHPNHPPISFLPTVSPFLPGKCNSSFMLPWKSQTHWLPTYPHILNIFFILKVRTALAGVAQWVEHWPANWKFSDRFPVRARAQVVGQVPNWGCVRGNQSMFLFLSPTHPL